MSLTERESHFEFGRNWQSYATSVDRNRIDQAVVALRKLFPEGLSGKSFLDIGCGSGIHALAAFELGAASVTALDLDEFSVATTRAMLSAHAPNREWTVRIASVFDLSPDATGTFDVVYSWGVLHHTGAMWRAIETSSRLVKPGGLYAIAIYTKTPRCDFWRKEKLFYSKSPRFVQAAIRLAYMTAFLGFLPATGWDPVGFVRNYKRDRGMNWSHNVHDWLGGYPYESASAPEMREKLVALGLTEVRSFEIDAGSGIWSAGCSEYVYRA
ncbi:MAG: class SAM-dependent methyltransferase [Bradyrhizobium sp.]|nr:class SAM-dependent methyltransferase [Bradyrhizobium sp.]